MPALKYKIFYIMFIRSLAKCYEIMNEFTKGLLINKKSKTQSNL